MQSYSALARCFRKTAASTPLRNLAMQAQIRPRAGTIFRPLKLRCIPGLLSQTISPTVHTTGEVQKSDEATSSRNSAALPAQQSVAEALPRILLTSSAAAFGTALLYSGAVAPEIVLSMDLVSAMQYNIPISAACAMLGDMVAQLVVNRGSSRPLKLDAKRLLTAGGIAGLLQGVGTTVWLANFNFLIPCSAVGFGSISEMLTLGGKVVVDSWIWGTLLNTASVLLRRTCAGDSLMEATRKWSDSIVGITAFEFKFWPVWGAVVYAFVPVADQVGAFAVGGFLWSIYLSMVANGTTAGTTTGIPRKLAWYGRPVGCRRSSASGGSMSAGLSTSAGVLLASSGSRCKVQKNKYVAAVAGNSHESRRPTYRLLRMDKQTTRTGLPRGNGAHAITL